MLSQYNTRYFAPVFAGILHLALVVGFLSFPTNVTAGQPDTIVLSPQVLAETKKRVLEKDPALMPAYKTFMADAANVLLTPIQPVIFKPFPPPGGSLHDYWSLDPEWWPNNHTPDGLPYVHLNGKRNPQLTDEQYDRGRLRQTAANALTLALAYYMTGDEEYAGKGTAVIWAWCCDSVTRMKPVMDYAHYRPGDSAGHHSGIIETRDLIKIIDAVRLLEPSPAWSKAVAQKVTKWFSDYVDWLQKSPFGRLEANSPDHHGTWFDAQLAVFTLSIGRENDARTIVENVLPRRIRRQIKANGSMPQELQRARSRYSTFLNLKAFFILACVGERLNMDVWNRADPDGASIRSALDFAAPAIAGDSPWSHGKTGTYDPFDFTALFHRAALVYKDDGYIDYLKALPPQKLRQDRAQLFY